MAANKKISGSGLQHRLVATCALDELLKRSYVPRVWRKLFKAIQLKNRIRPPTHFGVGDR
jgi:hypothetical protein